jgi:hypothetical protein
MYVQNTCMRPHSWVSPEAAREVLLWGGRGGVVGGGGDVEAVLTARAAPERPVMYASAYVSIREHT